MIQKNRIMTKKGIIIFDRNIDVEKTQENGKKVCEAYAPLIQQRIRLKMRLPLHTGSLIQVSSDIKSGNGIESEYINRIMKEGDQVDCFLNYIDEMIEMDEKAEKYTFDKKKFTVTSKDKKYLDVGEYEVSLKYSKESKDVPFEVKDTKAPVFEDFLTEIRIEQNAEDVDLKDYFKANDLSSAEITIDKQDFDIKKKGKYDISVSATDKYKNTTEKKSVVVKVVDSKDAKKNGLTETVDGKIPMSKETKEKVDKGETTIKKSEDKVEKPNSDKNNSNSNNNSNNSNEKPNSDKPSKPNNDNNTSKPSEPSHKHKWVEQFKTVHHEEKGHYENVMIADKWIEYKPIYETQEHSFCSVCHLDLTANNIVPWKHAEEHMLNGEAGGHYTDSVLVQVGTEEIVHEAVYEKRWIVDKPAWDEKVSTGFKCECGATK